mmetsp:Transcript_41347/g.133278  ORF Transcript_41347/g.133278 Transcript_41347/m.133278 type:complete len:325 (+) Transcript_41347:328-1302(+)
MPCAPVALAKARALCGHSLSSVSRQAGRRYPRRASRPIAVFPSSAHLLARGGIITRCQKQPCRVAIILCHWQPARPGLPLCRQTLSLLLRLLPFVLLVPRPRVLLRLQLARRLQCHSPDSPPGHHPDVLEVREVRQVRILGEPREGHVELRVVRPIRAGPSSERYLADRGLFVAGPRVVHPDLPQWCVPNAALPIECVHNVGCAEHTRHWQPISKQQLHRALLEHALPGLCAHAPVPQEHCQAQAILCRRGESTTSDHVMSQDATAARYRWRPSARPDAPCSWRVQALQRSTLFGLIGDVKTATRHPAEQARDASLLPWQSEVE